MTRLSRGRVGWGEPQVCVAWPRVTTDTLGTGCAYGPSRLHACRDRKGQAGQISEWASLGLGPVPTSESELAPLSEIRDTGEAAGVHRGLGVPGHAQQGRWEGLQRPGEGRELCDPTRLHLRGENGETGGQSPEGGRRGLPLPAPTGASALGVELG